MERTFNQKVIELAYPQVGPIAIMKGCSPKEAQVEAVMTTLELLLIQGHKEAKEFMRPFLLAAARQILNPVPDVTDEDREMVNILARNKLNLNHSKSQ